MRYFFRKLAGIVAAGGIASVPAAQGQTYAPVLPPQQRSYLWPFGKSSCPPPPCPLVPELGGPVPVPPNPPNPEKIPNPPQQAAEAPPPTPPADDLLAGESEAKSTFNTSTVVAAGKGLGSAVFDPHNTSVLTPLVLPGLFTASTAQSAIPMNRVFTDFAYFSGNQVVNPPQLVVVKNNGSMMTSIYPPPPPRPPFSFSVAQQPGTSTGFNLNVFDVGFEKTFLNGLGSVYVSVPWLYAADNISGQQIDGLGDINAGFKIALYGNDAGSTITAGLTVSVPTGHPAVTTSYVQTGNGLGATLVPSTTSSTNPTFLQPWLAGVYIVDRFFIQEYAAIMISTDSQVPAFFNSNLTTGYTVYQNRNAYISSVTPTMSVGLLLPFGHQGTPSSDVTVPLPNMATVPAPSAFSFTDQVTLTGGLQVGLGNRWLFSAGVVTPLAGPVGFNVGAVASLNFLF